MRPRGGARGQCISLSCQLQFTNKWKGAAVPEICDFLPRMVMLPWGMWLQGDTGIHFPCHSVNLCISAGVSPNELLKWSLQVSRGAFLHLEPDGGGTFSTLGWGQWRTWCFHDSFLGQFPSLCGKSTVLSCTSLQSLPPLGLPT